MEYRLLQDYAFQVFSSVLWSTRQADDKNNINKLVKIIDWKAIKSSYWGGDENLDVKRRKQAEFLIHEDLSADCIVGFACFNENSKDILISYNFV